jgi:hypothetical protein
MRLSAAHYVNDDKGPTWSNSYIWPVLRRHVNNCRPSRTLFELVKPGGVASVLKLCYGYLKNVALAVAGRLDRHFTELWEVGHIKFSSIATLRHLFSEAGFQDIYFARVVRIPPVAKSNMVPT